MHATGSVEHGSLPEWRPDGRAVPDEACSARTEGGGLVRVLVLLIAVVMLGLVGCQQASETTEKAETTGSEQMATGDEQEAPVMDPVCGMQVSRDSEWTAEYDGRTYYFCSQDCRDKFMEDPGAYAKDDMGESGEMMHEDMGGMHEGD
jgi:YHS domain-containing protein